MDDAKRIIYVALIMTVAADIDIKKIVIGIYVW